MRIALATAAALPALTPDDRVLLERLRAWGHDAWGVVWEDGYERWDTYDLVVIRSCWDYAYRHEAFVRWACHVADATRLWNPAPLIRWNTHKRYLLDLERAGVEVVPTVVLERGTSAALPDLMQDRGWEEIVVKPAVGASARLTRRVGRTETDGGAELLGRLLEHEDAIVQPFESAVEREGEVSVVWIAGRAIHAVRKRPAEGEFRVQAELGGRSEDEPLTPALLAIAERAVAVADPAPVFARVDVLPRGDGSYAVMELELVEPELFFSRAAMAVEAFADAVARVEEVGV